MSDCSKHKKSVGPYTDMSELTEDGNLHYGTNLTTVNDQHRSYEKIINGDDGTEFELLSDISTHFWNPSTFKKVNTISPRLKYFLTDQELELVQKGPYTHKGKGFMVYNGNGLYSPNILNKPIL